MKKFLGIMMALFACLSLGSCNKEEAKEDEGIMSYTEFMAAESGENVVIRGFIAAKQGFWNNSVSCYLTTDKAGEGYFVFGLPCTENENNSTYAIGNYIEIKATKTIYAGEHEIMGKDIIDVKQVETTKKQATTAIDLNDKLDTLFDYQNSYFTVTMNVKSVSYKGDKGTDDIYLTLTKDDKDLNCCIETNLTAVSADVYMLAMSLEEKIGASVTVKGYLYWWSDSEDSDVVKANGANPHITEIVVNEK